MSANGSYTPPTDRRQDKMPCPVKKCEGDDHRWCLVELFKTNRIKSLADWQEMCKPKTIVKGKVKARVAKE